MVRYLLLTQVLCPASGVWFIFRFFLHLEDCLAKISPDGEFLVADAGALPCGRPFRPMGELLFIAIKSNQKALARFRSKARLKSRRPRRKRNSHGASVAVLRHPFS